MTSKWVTIDDAAEKLMESDMSNPDISAGSVIDLTYKTDAQQSEKKL